MAANLFHPVEHEILAQFFKTKSLHPVKVHDLKEDAANNKDYIGLAKSSESTAIRLCAWKNSYIRIRARAASFVVHGTTHPAITC